MTTFRVVVKSSPVGAFGDVPELFPPSGRVNSRPSRLLDPKYAYLNDVGWKYSGVHRGNG